MNRKHPSRQQAPYHHDPRFGGVLLASLGAHLAVVLLFSGVIIPRHQRPSRPVYHVDLVNLPVKSPQAGRPDARPEIAKEKPKPPAPAPPKPATPAKPEAIKVAKPEAVKPAVQPKKPDAAKAKAIEKPSVAEEKALQEKLRQMQARKEREDYKQRLAEMAANDTRQAAAASAVPVGMPTGRGTDKGSAWDLWIQTFLKGNWSLSKYQVSRHDLEAKVRIVYDAQGNLVDLKFLKPSGDTTFDDSVKRAVLLEKQLPKKPGERMEFDVVFNLKELLK